MSASLEIASNVINIALPNDTVCFVHTSASGCPDMAAPAHAWYKREEATAIIGCKNNHNTWHFMCEEGVWIGVVGNCSEPGTTSNQHYENV